MNLQIDNALKCGVYANILAVSLNPNEAVLDFGYKLPVVDQEEPTVQIVARINISPKTLESMIENLKKLKQEMEVGQS